MINDTDKCYLCLGTIFWPEKAVVIIEDIETGNKGIIDCFELGNEIIYCWDDNIRKHNMRKAHKSCYDEAIRVIRIHLKSNYGRY